MNPSFPCPSTKRAVSDSHPHLLPLPDDSVDETKPSPQRLQHTRHESAEKVRNALGQILHELSGEHMLFLRSFLLEGNHADDVGVMTNQVSLAHAYGQHAMSESSTIDGRRITHESRSMYVPHFTVNLLGRSLTLGVFCEYSVTNLPSEAVSLSDLRSEFTMLSMGRYVLDNVTGMRLQVLAIPDTVALGIVLFKPLSTTATTIVGIGVHGKSFCQALATNDNIGLQASVLFADLVLAKRSCAVCGSPQRKNCACKFDARIPKHPFDHASHGLQLRRLTGSFELGATSVLNNVMPNKIPVISKMWKYRKAANSRRSGGEDFELFSPSLNIAASSDVLELSRDYIFSALLPQGLSAKLTEITGLARSLSLNTPTTQATSPRAPGSDSGADDVSSEWRTKILAVRRLLTAPEGTTVTNPGCVSVSKYEDQHELKMERRREKNRAAATKSNAARKERLLKLRSDLRDAKSAAGSLLKKKRLLEEENEVLRDQIMASILEDLV